MSDDSESTIKFNQRTDTYLAVARYDKPKQVFRLLADLIGETNAPKGARFTDIGCATGEMIYFLKRQFPEFVYCGVDNQSELLSHARTQPSLVDVQFIEHDALTYRAEPSDFLTCFGMLGIFDEFEPLMESLLANCRKGGRIYVHGLFNPADIDVRIYYKDNQNKKDWNRGFNLFAIRRITEWLASRVQSTRFIRFEMETDIPRRPDTPHRAYTIKVEDGRRVTTNGLCLMLPEHVLEIVV
jgi:trans-aconitate methyltransferase